MNREHPPPAPEPCSSPRGRNAPVGACRSRCQQRRQVSSDQLGHCGGSCSSPWPGLCAGAPRRKRPVESTTTAYGSKGKTQSTSDAAADDARPGTNNTLGSGASTRCHRQRSCGKGTQRFSSTRRPHAASTASDSVDSNLKRKQPGSAGRGLPLCYLNNASCPSVPGRWEVVNVAPPSWSQTPRKDAYTLAAWLWPSAVASKSKTSGKVRGCRHCPRGRQAQAWHGSQETRRIGNPPQPPNFVAHCGRRRLCVVHAERPTLR